jgi:GAF domain/ANTAR domain
MAELGVVTRTLLAIARDSADDDHAVAGRICRACVEGLAVDGGAISLLTLNEARETLWANDATAELLEDLQFSLNEGACIQAASTGAPVLVPDLAHSTATRRWPMFAAAVAEQAEVGALFALPLQWGAVNLGVLDLYRHMPGGLSQAQWRDALSAAETAALMLLGQRTDPGDGRGGWLDHAVGNRAEIHQATGMVLVQLGVGAPEALARMRGYAFAQQRLLIDVARDVVSRRLTFCDNDE